MSLVADQNPRCGTNLEAKSCEEETDSYGAAVYSINDVIQRNPDNDVVQYYQ